MASSVTNSSSSAGRGGGTTGRRGPRRLSGAGGGEQGRQVPPVDAFVVMENDSAVDLCEIVSSSLGSVKKVRWSMHRGMVFMVGHNNILLKIHPIVASTVTFLS